MKQRGFAPVIILIFVFFMVAIALAYLFVTKPYRIVGSPIKPFKAGEIVLGEKISYLFTEPKIGDRITFQPTSGSNYIGIIIKIEQDNNGTKYRVSSAGGTNPWDIRKNQIAAKIYYPFVNDEEIKQIISSLPPPN